MFTHLHARSGYSWGYGTATPADLVRVAAKSGMDEIALMDRDTMFGVPTFVESCRQNGVSPVVGAEITAEGGGHLVLLAQSERGYRNLSRLITSYRCALEDRRKPLCPLETVLEHAEGLVCLGGAVPYGYLPEPLLSGDTAQATRRVETLREAFGSDYLYVELTSDLTAGSKRRVRAVHEFARIHGIPAVVANEVAYPIRELKALLTIRVT